MEVNRLDLDMHIDNTVGEHAREQGVKMITFVAPSAVEIMGEDLDDPSVLRCCVVGLKNAKTLKNAKKGIW